MLSHLIVYHENPKYPPLCQSISQIRSQSYETAKTLSSILKKYIPDKFSMISTDELTVKIRLISSTGLIVSLYVTSSFTNVPVRDTV